MIPVVDIFAGPGGLSEGFSSVRDGKGQAAFDVVLSVEKELHEFETLRLRTFFRQFPTGQAPDDYYRFLCGEKEVSELYERHPSQSAIASAKTWRAELGHEDLPSWRVSERIDRALGKCRDWVLIGGPPCQAYSVAGRSRNQAKNGYNPETDIRQRLYVEYLQILGDSWTESRNSTAGNPFNLPQRMLQLLL